MAAVTVPLRGRHQGSMYWGEGALRHWGNLGVGQLLLEAETRPGNGRLCGGRPINALYLQTEFAGNIRSQNRPQW